MTGKFELFTDEHASYAFRLKSHDGTVVAVSGPYPNKESAVQGIRDVRECAATGLISDQCSPSRSVLPENS
ncbi:YegP family protein [Arthrobacter sp.]|uniref:YegP family protein n=1 Tax=Arthrobacter sp. TaxID=1667 RepID=UPI0028110EFC|nr:YegP family protein [Arthrobacter sp.]